MTVFAYEIQPLALSDVLVYSLSCDFTLRSPR